MSFPRAHLELNGKIFRAFHQRNDSRGRQSCGHCGQGRVRVVVGEVCSYCGARVVGVRDADLDKKQQAEISFKVPSGGGKTNSQPTGRWRG